jgi:hypothetical protein
MRLCRVMELDRFWAIVDGASKAASSTDGRVEHIGAALAKLKKEEIVGFDNQLRVQFAGSYTADLWAAAYVIQGGCSDDGFAYFRAWLVLQGRARFEQAVRLPDTLADLQIAGEPEAEELMYVASTAYNDVTGETDFHDHIEVAPCELVGELWSDDSALVRIVPKLVARYSAK